MTKYIISYTKLLFSTSVAVFLSAIFITNAWLPELAASLSVFHAITSLIFLTIFYFAKNKPWLLAAAILLTAQVFFVTMSYFNGEPLKLANDYELNAEKGYQCARQYGVFDFDDSRYLHLPKKKQYI